MQETGKLASSQRPSLGWAWLVLVGFLIGYGSLHPFEFAEPASGALARLFQDWTLVRSRGDMLGNVALFVPWGFAGMLVIASREQVKGAVAVTALTGILLALGCQVAQLWVPSRVSELSDVFWNVLGLAAGMFLGSRALMRRKLGAATEAGSFAAAYLLGAWLLAFWLPLVPSLDLQLLKTNLKDLMSAHAFSLGEFMVGLPMAMMSGYLLSRIWGLRASLIWLLPLLGLAAVGKLFVHGARIDASVLLGFVAGTIAWWGCARVAPQLRTVIVGITLLLAYTLQGLSPFDLRAAPAAFVWSPLTAMLTGSMLANAQALANSLVVFVSLLFLVQVAGGRPAAASVGLAVWVAIVEMTQTIVVSRTGDITQPLMVLLLGQAFRFSGRASFANAPKPEQSTPAHVRAAAASTIQRTLVLALALVTSGAVVISLLLRLPGIPYNVRELFRDDGSPLVLAVFTLALLWAGAGSAWLGVTLAKSRYPAWLLPPLALAAGLISLSLLWLSVTAESIADISGSSNLYWFVTNKNIWGDAWRLVFLNLDAPEAVGFLERCVRYSALYAPLPIISGLMVAFRQLRRRHQSVSLYRAFGVLVSAALTLWLCKAIAFDWSSTDNLNELIAPDGKWGWGGGGFLYLLVGLICLNSVILTEGLGGTAFARTFSVFFTLGAVPLGWWLLNSGLDQQVEKYGLVFSGTQFLLGPDRSQVLSAEVLFVRWALVQASATMLIAAGIWLGSAFAAHRRAGLDRALTRSLSKHD